MTYLKIILNRIKNILFYPKSEWDKIKVEEITNSDLFMKYALILALILPLSNILNWLFLGFAYGFSSTIFPIVGASFKMYVNTLINVMITSFAIKIIGNLFKHGTTFNDATKIAVYSNTAIWIGGVYKLFGDSLQAIIIVGAIYSFVLLFLGIRSIINIKKTKLIIFYVLVILTVMGLNFIVDKIT